MNAEPLIEWRLMELLSEAAALAGSLNDRVLGSLLGASACAMGDRLGLSDAAVNDLQRRTAARLQARLKRPQQTSAPKRLDVSAKNRRGHS